jgi:hypothetical protein
MALIALVIGITTSVAATGRTTLMLVASGAVCWSFVPVVQLFTGVLFVRGARIPRAQALERYFALHRPWSLWLLGCALVLLLMPNQQDWILPVAASGVVPLILTNRALARAGHHDLGFTSAIARRRLITHQLATWAVGLAYAEYAGRVVSRFVDALRP